MSLSIGEKAPDFKLNDKDGKEFSLADFAGKYLIIYFYPKDNTPGCTKESCTFRDNITKFSDLNAEVVGISKDGAKSHAKFIEKFELPFTLLCDEETKMMQDYDCWKEKKLYGKTYMGCVRSTVIIDPQGNVAHHWPKVTKAEVHPLAVLEKLEEITQG